MGLVEIFQICGKKCRGLARRGFHSAEQRLKPPNPGETLWRKPDPIAKKSAQMTGARPAFAGELRDLDLPLGVRNEFRCFMNSRIHSHLSRPFEQESFQHVQPCVGRLTLSEKFL